MSRGKPTKAAKVWGCRPPLELESQLDELLDSWRAQIEKSGTGERPPSKSDLVSWMLNAGVHKFKREVLGERTRSKPKRAPAPEQRELDVKPNPEPKRSPAKPKPELVIPEVSRPSPQPPAVEVAEPTQPATRRQQQPKERRSEPAGERRDIVRPMDSAGRRNYDILKRVISINGIEETARLMGVSVIRVERATEDPSLINRLKWEAFINHPDVKRVSDSLL